MPQDPITTRSMDEPVDSLGDPTWQAPPSELELAAQHRNPSVWSGLVAWLAGTPDNTIARADFARERSAGLLGIAAMNVIGLIFFAGAAGWLGLLERMGAWGSVMELGAWAAVLAMPIGVIMLTLLARRQTAASPTGPMIVEDAHQADPSADVATGPIQDTAVTSEDSPSVQVEPDDQSMPAELAAMMTEDAKPRTRFWESEDFRARPKWQRSVELSLALVGGLLGIAMVLFVIPALTYGVLSFVVSSYLAAVGAAYAFAAPIISIHIWQQSTRLWRLGKLYGTDIDTFPHAGKPKKGKRPKNKS